MSRKLDEERIKNEKKAAREANKRERAAQKAAQARQRRRERNAKGPTPFRENVIFDAKKEAYLLRDSRVRIHTTNAGVQEKWQKRGVVQKSNTGESGGIVKEVEILERATNPSLSDLSPSARALRKKLQADERKRSGAMHTVFEGKPIQTRDPYYQSTVPMPDEIDSGAANLEGMRKLGAIVKALLGK